MSSCGRPCVVENATAAAAVSPLSRPDSTSMAVAYSQQFGGQGDGYLVLQNEVKHVEPGLFSLIQWHILH